MFNSIRHTILRSFYRLLKQVKIPAVQGRMLIVRPDAIGDYILFRNSLSVIKQSKRFKNYNITLLANIAYQDLALAFDRETIDEFLWVHPSEIYGINSYSKTTLKLLCKLKTKRFDVVVYPCHSRLQEVDSFIEYIGGAHTIASIGDTVNYGNEADKQKGDALYDELISVPSYDTFEFKRNTVFTQNLVGDSSIDIPLFLDERIQPIDSNHIILFPGAGHEFRRWSTAFFADVIKLLAEHNPQLKFTIAGSRSDAVLAQDIMSRAPEQKIEDLTGKTSLSELVGIFKQAGLLVSNETSAIHLAAGVGLSAVCISNGNHFGRFNPYPTELRSNIKTIYPSDIFTNPSMFETTVELNKIKSEMNISLISPQQVYEASILLLKATHETNPFSYHD